MRRRPRRAEKANIFLNASSFVRPGPAGEGGRGGRRARGTGRSTPGRWRRPRLFFVSAQKILDCVTNRAYVRPCPNSHVPVVAHSPRANRREGPGRFEGRGLKQRRSGLFWSQPALQRPGSLKRHLHLAGRAERDLPNPSEGSEETDCPVRLIDCPPANQLAMSRQTGRRRNGSIVSIAVARKLK